jgi:hypothetical protein
LLTRNSIPPNRFGSVAFEYLVFYGFSYWYIHSSSFLFLIKWHKCYNSSILLAAANKNKNIVVTLPIVNVSFIYCAIELHNCTRSFLHRATCNAPNSFPPKALQPGSIGNKDYTPLARIENAGNHIYNAPIIAFDVNAKQLNSFCNGNADYSLVYDKVVKICPEQGTVTIKLTPGFSFARPVLYLSMDASNPLAASMENATFSIKLGSIIGVCLMDQLHYF